MISASLIAALTFAALFPQDAAPTPRTPPAVAGAPTGDPATLTDVVVDGRQLDQLAQDYVEAVAAPARRRGLARWPGRVCVGAVNMRAEASQAVIDHVSRRALELGLRIGEPGCRPNVVIIFAADARSLATSLVEADRRAFHLGVGGLDRGSVALDAFASSDQPVRWWHVSMPVIGASHARAIRMPGDTGPIYVPGEGIVNRGRSISDDLNKAIIIVDVDQLAGTTLASLSEYLSMVALAQVDPDGDTGGQDTILNLFEDTASVQSLSEWDMTYLRSLYAAPSERLNPDRQAGALARRLRRERQAAPPEGAS